MSVTSTIFFLASLFLAIALGPQTRPWSWGPALIFLGLAALTAVPAWWRSQRSRDSGVIALGTLLILWFIWRASMSPVHEFAEADLLLLCGVVGSIITIRSILDNETSLKVFLWGLAALLAASSGIVAMQVVDPSFNPLFASRPGKLPSGFFGHYNEGANFLLGTSFLLAAAAGLGKHPRAIRAIWGIIAFAGLCAVYFTRSKSGILSLGTGAFAFAAATLIYGWKTKAKWLGAAVIALPITIAGASALVGYAWVKAQQAREYAIGFSDILFDIRLRIWGVAMSCIQSHPWAGGGSRSFSWECYQHLKIMDYGWHTGRPDMVHNEFLQALADYGLIAGIGLVALLVTLLVGAIVRLFSQEVSSSYRQADAIYIGGLAALAALLTQASFNFNLHLLPGAMILGTAMAFVSLPAPLPLKSTKSYVTLIPVTLITLSSAATALAYGWKGTQVTRIMAPFYFKAAGRPTEEDRSYALAQAAGIWPSSAFHRERSTILHRLAHKDLVGGVTSETVEEAISAYRAGLSLNPFDTTLSINLANLLNMVNRDEEARKEYERAEHLQGGMELAFRSYYHFANHLVKMGYRQLASGETGSAYESFTLAASRYEKASIDYPSLPNIGEGITLKEAIDLGLAMSSEQAGDLDEALEGYEKLAARGSNAGKYQMALLLNRVARVDWTERRAGKALGALLEAKDLLSSMKALPENVSDEDKTKLLTSINEAIETLTAGRIDPIPRSKRDH